MPLPDHRPRPASRPARPHRRRTCRRHPPSSRCGTSSTGCSGSCPANAAADVRDLLAGKPKLFSDAARLLALALTEDDENSPRPPAGLALALWREALAAGLPADAYVGWGSFAFADRVDDRDWLELTQSSCAVPPDLLRRGGSYASVGSSADSTRRPRSTNPQPDATTEETIRRATHPFSEGWALRRLSVPA